MKKLNLGCGFDRRGDYVNADNFKECNPDMLIDMRETPWLFEDNEYDHILIKRVLEYVGKDYEEFLSIMK